MQENLFSEKEKNSGKELLGRGIVRSLIFSEGTYQLEIEEEGESFFPFLQLTDSGAVLDSFCSCLEESYCSHVVAGYFHILQKKEPIHKIFRESFWNQVCLIASRAYGYRADMLEKEEGWKAFSLDGKCLFHARALNEIGEDKLTEILENRPVETEASSLKFSNLPAEELKRFRKGRPSDRLQYALSFWPDLAKWLFSLQEAKEPYDISLFKEGEVPSVITVKFPSVECSFFVSKEELPGLVPSFKTIKFPLEVYEAEEISIKNITYDVEKKQFLFQFSGKREVKKVEGIPVGLFMFVPDKGFFNQDLDPVFTMETIPKSEMNSFLTRHTGFIRKYLVEEIYEEVYSVKYHLHFDSKRVLHIEQYIFSLGDLKQKGAAFFGEWAYLPQKGFYRLKDSIFFEVETLIPQKEIGDFIEGHKAWLHEKEGFQIHPMSVESDVSYEVDRKGRLVFLSPIHVKEEGFEALDLGQWIFILQRGFFPKRKDGVVSSILAGEKVEEEEVPLFISQNEEELFLLSGFFASRSPIEKVGFKVFLEKEEVHIKPLFTLRPSCDKKKIRFFLEYVYVEGEGFSKIDFLPNSYRKYLKENILTPKQEAAFFAHIKEIEPWIVEMDPCLKAQEGLSLLVKGMEREEKKKTGQWILELAYETEVGQVPVYDIWKGIELGKNYVFSSAGRIDLSKGRFDWLKSFTKRRWSKDGGKVRLSSLEWIRVQTAELVVLPEGEEKKERKVREAFDSFSSFQSFLPLKTEKLKSTLRNYQKTGLKWLWFLYGYGLSGLLCDEMGLGKTHQAMGLMAAVSEVKKEPRQFLVVCPTSVIYHWEELLKTFLPDLKVYVFYGQSRIKEDLKGDYDVLLTSYGIVRTDCKLLAEIPFEVAIYDEVQNAKNSLSKTHKALKSMRASILVGLTGTPIENRLTELKSLFDLILPRYLPSDAKFKEVFIHPIERDKDPVQRELLSKAIKPFILRRKKTEVLQELPAKVEEISYCDLSDQQKKLYQELVHTYKQEIVRGGVQDNRKGMHIFALFSKLKQVCDHPSLIIEDTADYFEHSSGKWDLFIELLQEARDSGQKVVVFTQYLKMMDIIKQYLRGQHIEYAEIRGSTRDRRGQIKKFQEDPSCEVFVASLQAAGVGIDLTAASVVIHYDRWWNPAKENQATDRVHRIGQSRGVQVFKLVTKKTIEERIHELIKKKKGLLDEVVGFDDQDAVKSLSKAEIFELFSALEEDL